MTSVEKALENVDKYGALHFPVGKDRAALCHAACVLSAEVRRLRADVKMQSEMLSDWESDPDCRRLRSRLAMSPNRACREF